MAELPNTKDKVSKKIKLSNPIGLTNKSTKDKVSKKPCFQRIPSTPCAYESGQGIVTAVEDNDDYDEDKPVEHECG